MCVSLSFGYGGLSVHVKAELESKLDKTRAMLEQTDKNHKELTEMFHQQSQEHSDKLAKMTEMIEQISKKDTKEPEMAERSHQKNIEMAEKLHQIDEKLSQNPNVSTIQKENNKNFFFLDIFCHIRRQ